MEAGHRPDGRGAAETRVLTGEVIFLLDIGARGGGGWERGVTVVENDR